MAGELQSKSRPLSNKGLLLKADPALIPDDRYSELTNLVSVQEGNVTIRNGNRRITNAIGVTDTITKLRIKSSPQTDTYYVCTNGDIYAAPGPIPQAGETLEFSSVASGVSTGSNLPTLRIASADYSAGSVGTAWKFFGGNLSMVKHDGILSEAQKWGILLPFVPAVVQLDSATLLPNSDIVAGAGSATRLSGVTVSSVSGTAPGLITVTPNTIDQIYAGMLLTIGSQLGFVTQVNYDSFNIYLSTLPTASQSITSGILSKTSPATFPSISAKIDASLGGNAADGYSTDDPVHISISLSDPTQFQDIRLRVLVNGSSTDYYEKSILPSSIQSQISLQQNAVSTLQAATTQIDQGIVGGFDISDASVNTAKPSQLTPMAPNTTFNDVWTEIDIPKSSFTPVGNAGSGKYSWRNVTGFQIIYVASAGTTPQISISSIYIAGGAGPNAYSESQTNPLQPYRYVYTYRNPTTGAESNPSVEMIQSSWVQPNKQKVAVSIDGSNDPQITGSNSVAVYRAGGSFADNYYRFVGFAENPGWDNTVVFYDNQSDDTIAANDTAEFDNDAPVTSTLPVPCTMSLTGYYPDSSMGYGGFVAYFYVNVLTGPSANIADYLTPGSVIHLAINTTGAEDAVIRAVNPVGANTLSVFFQEDHHDFPQDGTTFAEVDAVAQQPCNLALSAYDSLFVAGDKNNPQVLYKSKTGRPEAFPVINIANGTSNQINVGTPSNPIMNMVEYAGGVLCMNYRDLNLVGIASGVMGTPQQTPAQRGLYSRNAWCVADNAIWYLGYDGIYSWSGGQAIWRSEAIDPLFTGVGIGNYLPVDMTPGLGNVGSDMIEMAYNDNEIQMVYTDTAGVCHRLRYHTKFDRWSIDDIYDPAGGSSPVMISAYYEDIDFGEILLAKSIAGSSYLCLDNTGTSDGWFTNPYDGQPIAYACTPGTLIGASTAIEKLFSDFVIELQSDQAPISIQSYYNFSTTADATDAWSIAKPPAPVGRVRYPFSFHAAVGGFQAHALAQRFSGSSAYPVTFYSLITNLIPLAQYSSGRAFDYTDLGWPYDKIFQALDIEIDTGGVQASIQPYGDGSPMGPPLTLTTTATDRRRVLSMTSGPATGQTDLICKNVKMVLTPGVGGKMDYFNHEWKFIKEPPSLTHFDTFEFTFDYDGYSFIKQCWLEYMCSDPINLVFYVDNGAQFYSVTLPAHPQRDVARFYFPEAVGTVLNKSKRHRLTVDSSVITSPFKIYKDSSRLEWLACGSDQRSAYQQAPLSTFMGPQV